MSLQIIRYTLFESNSSGHGGAKRTAQISELLKDLGLSWERIPTGVETPKISIKFFIKVLRNISLFFQVFFIIQRCFHPYWFYKTLILANRFKGIFFSEKRKDNAILLWESTKSEFSFVVPYFRQKGYKIIAVPHNLESLVPGQKSGITNRISPHWFMEEIKIFRKCDMVFAISREDTLLLKQFEVNAFYLPYYPTNDTFDNLLKIRKDREHARKDKSVRKKILMLGSSINPPTKEGMIDRIKFFVENKFLESYDLLIAGYGTKELRLIVNPKDNIYLFGELTTQQLSDVLVGTDIILIHQPATSGALTRIIEMLIVGIPILANFESGRNYYGADGLYIYFNDKQLINYLNNGNFPVPDIPRKPTFEIELFKQTILSIT